MLSPGRDHLFFEKVDCSKQSLTGAMTRGAVVMTPALIAMIPLQSAGISIGATILTRYDVGGDSPVDAVKRLLADPAAEAVALEAALREMLGGSETRWLFPIVELETFEMKTGFFGMISLKMPGESVRRMVIRDKGGKVAAKEFYGAHVASRAAG